MKPENQMLQECNWAAIDFKASVSGWAVRILAGQAVDFEFHSFVTAQGDCFTNVRHGQAENCEGLRLEVADAQRGAVRIEDGSEVVFANEADRAGLTLFIFNV